MLWSLARHDLGLSDEEFYALTPRQFHALSLRKKEEIERSELLMGIQTATLANHSMNPPKKAYTPFYFMPSKQREKAAEERKPKRFTRQGLADKIRTQMSMLSGSRVVYVASEAKKEG